MPDVGPTAVLPRRPLTVGELLDSAVLLLRGQARLLIPLAVPLALGEQLLLHPLRVLADARPPEYWLDASRLGGYWVLLAVGAATEAMIIAVLGNPAARGAGAALLGRRAGLRELLRPAGARWGATAAVALAVGLGMLLAALLGPVWFLAYGLLGAAVPALVVDRLPAYRAPLRALGLAVRAGARAAGIRLLGYVGWWLIRLGIGLGVFYGLMLLAVVDLTDPAWAVPVATAAWVAVNAVAYPALACLDAVLHLETRMRTEGLDIRLSRAPAGTPEPVLLAVRR
ncbi:hypothetical protein DKT69_06410 [Micromonospora sicca]|uniref:Glycerophosphoryl diester phosphodiesterase membrane domain-containing protein n=1 Tax=Micromonospora sicca TaxID=2202420 RepID=A0A317DTQ2_9ACTN|nr:hypothetical protein [Micromonospora sp. 4G51]PWR16303.1 hypothetical protein DKT69_06410 [Micromonospora sp. 4G51]